MGTSKIINLSGGIGNIDNLDAIDQVNDDDNFVVSRDATNKRLTGQLFKSAAQNTNELYYGVKWTVGQSNPVITQVGKAEMIAEMPLHDAIRAAVVNDNRTVNYYLDKYQLTKKADGSASDLTGADGQVMVLMPDNFYFKDFIDTQAKERYFLISPYALPGFTKRTRRAIGVYPGYLDGTKLASISGVMPTTSKSPVQFLDYAKARGAGWYSFSYQAWEDIMIMYLIAYANFNSQAAWSAGVTNASSSDWSNFNGYAPFIQNGEGDDLYLRNGEIQVSVPNFVGGTDPLVTQIGVLYQLRLMTGIYEWVCGLNVHNSSALGSRAFIAEDAANFDYDTELNHVFKGNLAPADGYTSEWLPGSILAKAVGGSSSTHKSDYFYTAFDSDPDSGWRAVAAFGLANAGGIAGLGCAYSHTSSGHASSHYGSRLCCDVNA